MGSICPMVSIAGQRQQRASLGRIFPERSQNSLCSLLGIAFSPSGSHLYVADTGMTQAFYGNDFSVVSSM